MRFDEAKTEALEACAALIRVNASEGEGDLWGEEWEYANEPDRNRYAKACEEIADELIRRAERRRRG